MTRHSMKEFDELGAKGVEEATKPSIFDKIRGKGKAKAKPAKVPAQAKAPAPAPRAHYCDCTASRSDMIYSDY